MVISALSVLFLAAPHGVFADSNGLEPIEFPGDSLLAVIGDISKLPLPQQDLKLLGAKVYFGSPRPRPDGKQVAYLFINLTLDGKRIRDQWSQEVSRSLTDTGGCSQQTVHSVGATVGADGRLNGHFHVKHVKRSCGSWPWPLKGGWATDVGTVETDVWQDFQFVLTPDHRSVSLVMSGRASDNVSDFMRNLAKVIGNLAALCPITSSIGLGFDTQIFGALKAERDALEEAGKLRLLAQAGIDQPNLGNITLDLAYDSARFENGPVIQIVLRTTPENALSVGQARAFRKFIIGQQHQHETIGQKERLHQVAKGDSAWSIAKRFYDEPEFYWFIAAANSLGEAEIAELRIGQVLTIPPVRGILWDLNRLVITRGDSLWKIAQGDIGKFQRLLAENRRLVKDPDRIYPLQIIRR